jgi:hypothetical protein
VPITSRKPGSAGGGGVTVTVLTGINKINNHGFIMFFVTRPYKQLINSILLCSNSMEDKVYEFAKWFLNKKLYTLPDMFFLIMLLMMKDNVGRLIILLVLIIFKLVIKKNMLKKINELENGKH